MQRFTKSAVNWTLLNERLHSRFAKEIDALMKQHGKYWSAAVSKPFELEKYDFATLKKEMPEHLSTLDVLQKQFESIKIPYGTIPEKFNMDGNDFERYHEARTELLQLWADFTSKKIKATESKWARAPPVEHMLRDHLPEFFPTKARDYRTSEHAFYWNDDIDIDDPKRKELDRAYEEGHDDYQGFTSMTIEAQRERAKKSEEHIKGRYVHPWVPKQLVPPD